MGGEEPRIDYECWYPDVPPVMDTTQLAELLGTSEQVIRAWARDGVVPSHRRPGARKFRFLRHEIFEWLLAHRYEPEEGQDPPERP